MKLKFVLFATIKNLDQHIEKYQLIAGSLRNLGCEMIEPWVVDDYPSSEEQQLLRTQKLVQNTNNVVEKADFAIADFSQKSRTVFFQSITAIEKKLPLLCLVNELEEENYPDKISVIGGNLVTIKKYTHVHEINDILVKFLEDFRPPETKLNILAKRSTINQLKSLCKELDISKSELIRRMVSKEYRRIFE